ncbi:putative F-box domain, leucine-rich repeat domain, L domain-containing protein [Medicago truncatula]|uniref:F-box protein n=1 Tax=Medicago truncatula TaxID=3880 RepID=G7JI35_MEDTR|nr:F-box protein [Medicago truncatula]RHN58528.1 putative F-box domain, leucine-rich repeat domain, L domain-containing protein [Medicago truncatula]
MVTATASSAKSKVPKTMAAEACSNLPDELWEYIIKFLDGDHCTVKSLSIVSKQLLSITYSFRFTLKITQQTIPFIPRLLQRCRNITSLNLTSINLPQYNHLNTLLTQISALPLDLKSLILSNLFKIPKNGLRPLSKKMKNLTSFMCFKITWINKKDIYFIADCFPSLEVLVLKETRSVGNIYPYPFDWNYDFELDDDNKFLALPKLRKISLYGNSIDSQIINYLRKNRGPFTEEKNNLDGNDTA